MPRTYTPLQATMLPRHFIPDEEWEKLRLALPGFRELEAADSATHRSRKEKKRPTSRAYTLYKKIDRIVETPKLGRTDAMSSLPQTVITLKDGQGEIVLMPETKTAYTYHTPDKGPATTQAIAHSLMVAAGWHTPESVAASTFDHSDKPRLKAGLRVRSTPVEMPITVTSQKRQHFTLAEVKAYMEEQREAVLKAHQAYKAVHGEDGIHENPYSPLLREHATTIRTISALQEKGVHWAGYTVGGLDGSQLRDNIAFLATIAQDRPELVPAGDSPESLKQINSIIHAKRQVDAKRHKEQTVRIAQLAEAEETRAKIASAILKGMTIAQVAKNEEEPAKTKTATQAPAMATINTPKIADSTETEKALAVNVAPPASLGKKIETSRPLFGGFMSWAGEQMKKIRALGKKPAIAIAVGLAGSALFIAQTAPISPVTKALFTMTVASGALLVGASLYTYQMIKKDLRRAKVAQKPKTAPALRQTGPLLAT